MKKIYLTLFFTITLSSELILEITQGTENPFRVALLEFDGDNNISHQIDNIIKNNLKRSGELQIFEGSDLLSIPSNESEVIFNDFKILNIDYLVMGKIKKDGSSLSVIYEVYEIKRGKKIRTSTVFGIPNKILGNSLQLNIEFIEGMEMDKKTINKIILEKFPNI